MCVCVDKWSSACGSPHSAPGLLGRRVAPPRSCRPSTFLGFESLLFEGRIYGAAREAVVESEQRVGSGWRDVAAHRWC